MLHIRLRAQIEVHDHGTSSRQIKFDLFVLFQYVISFDNGPSRPGSGGAGLGASSSRSSSSVRAVTPGRFTGGSTSSRSKTPGTFKTPRTPSNRKTPRTTPFTSISMTPAQESACSVIVGMECVSFIFLWNILSTLQ
jgi:hypothetical protein